MPLEIKKKAIFIGDLAYYIGKRREIKHIYRHVSGMNVNSPGITEVIPSCSEK
jgi:hypothetical protein